MLTPEGMKDFSTASTDDQRTIYWAIARMQVELPGFLTKCPGEPGDPEIHEYVAKKVQVYFGSLLRELKSVQDVSA